LLQRLINYHKLQSAETSLPQTVSARVLQKYMSLRRSQWATD